MGRVSDLQTPSFPGGVANLPPTSELITREGRIGIPSFGIEELGERAVPSFSGVDSVSLSYNAPGAPQPDFSLWYKLRKWAFSPFKFFFTGSR